MTTEVKTREALATRGAIVPPEERFSALYAESARVYVRMLDGRSYYGTVRRAVQNGSVWLELWGVLNWRRFRLKDIKLAQTANVTNYERERQIRIAQRDGRSPRAQTSADVASPRRVRA